MNKPKSYRGKRLLRSGSADVLPLELELKGASNRAIVYLLFAAIMIFFAYKGINAVPADLLGPFGSSARLMVRIGVGLGAMLVIVKVLIDFFVTSTRFTVDSSGVFMRKRLLTGSKEWSVPLSEYEGVRWRHETISERTGSTPGNYRTRQLHIIELVHEDQEKTVPLFIGMNRKPGLGFAKEVMEQVRNADSASAEELRAMEAEVARIGSMTEAGDPSELRKDFARLLGVPEIE